MAIPEEIREKTVWLLTRYCARRVPIELSNQVQLGYRFRGASVTLFERRSGFRVPGAWTESPIAQFRFDCTTSLWALYCRDRNRRWHRYTEVHSSPDLNDLLQGVDEDSTGIFWG